MDETNEDWKVVKDKFFEQVGLVHHQLSSYNDFIENTLQDIVQDTLPIHIEIDQLDHDTKSQTKLIYTFEFKKIVIMKPQIIEHDQTKSLMYPRDARLRNFTYTAPMFLEIDKQLEIKTATGSSKQCGTENVLIGYIPVMLGSDICNLKDKSPAERVELGECIYDPMGYFIINGNEKVLIAQERMARNIVCVYNSKKELPTCEISSVSESSSRTNSSCIIKPFLNKSNMGSNNEEVVFRISVPYTKKNTFIPIAVLFRALGIVRQKQMIQLICQDQQDQQMFDLLRPSFEEAYVNEQGQSDLNLQNAALEFIGHRAATQIVKHETRLSYAKSTLSKYFLPHVSISDTDFEKPKALFMAYMINQLCQCLLDRRKYDDRDYLGNKRLDVAGSLLAQLFKQSFFRITRETTMQLEKKLSPCKDGQTIAIEDLHIAHILSVNDVTRTFKHALSTGNWTACRKTTVKTGVAQVLSRYSFMAATSHLRRISSAVAKDGAILKPRLLHNTHFGRICPAYVQSIFQIFQISTCLINFLF